MTRRRTESDEPAIDPPIPGPIALPQLVSETRDIRPGDCQIMDVVVHCDGDTEVYGWTNESHILDPRQPNWTLPGPHYRVKATITANEGRWESFLWLDCDVMNNGTFSLYPVARFTTAP